VIANDPNLRTNEDLERAVRALAREFKTETVFIIGSQAARLDPKDKDFVAAYHRARPLDVSLIEKRIAETAIEPTLAKRAVAFLRGLARKT
jgi:hypothetical protein